MWISNTNPVWTSAGKVLEGVSLGKKERSAVQDAMSGKGTMD